MQGTSSGRLARLPESQVARSLSAMKNVDNDVQYRLLSKAQRHQIMQTYKVIL